MTAGGATVFPLLGVAAPPSPGSALFWYNLRRSGRPDYRTVHASCPVLLGAKSGEYRRGSAAPLDWREWRFEQ